ncbi:DnaJ domain-containing protein [Coprinopsis sp. MPI-PUGE-AT-0042]|nr:DnaJ domain-containing protein [Coprinopsis sp. MPI-PUGE-AT-0042]
MSGVGAGDDDISPYELLEVGIEATEQEIKTSYRKRSLKVHPDRNPNNPDAARKFHELNQAYELLLDPLRRLALDAKLRLKNARKERFKAYDAKRKNLVEELEERERAFKKARVEKAQEEARVRYETEHIKDQGRKLVEERERKLREAERAEREEKEREKAALRRMAEDVDEPPALDQFDTTVRLKYALKHHGDLTDKEAIAAFLAPFGAVDVDSIVFSMKARKSKKTGESSAAPTHATALVPFKTIGDAYGAVCASSAPATSPLSKKVDMKGMEIGWVSGKEPAILGWLKKMGKLPDPAETKADMASPPAESRGGSSAAPSGTGTPSFSFATEDEKPKGSMPFSSFPDMNPTSHPAASTVPSFSFSAAPGMDYEGLTLLRMRQAERERLEREILEREKEEEGDS